MPWATEFHKLLSEDSGFLDGKNVWKILLWLDSVTVPGRSDHGPFAAVANRRRVWTTCQELLVEAELARKPSPHFDRTEIRRHSRLLPARSLTATHEVLGAPASFWLYSWDDIGSARKELETFWDAEGFLVGISMSFSGGEYTGRRALLGVDDSGIGITRQAEAVGTHDWPTGFVFHILPDGGNREFENCFSTAVTVGERRVPDANYNQIKNHY